MKKKKKNKKEVATNISKQELKRLATDQAKLKLNNKEVKHE